MASTVRPFLTDRRGYIVGLSSMLVGSAPLRSPEIHSLAVGEIDVPCVPCDLSEEPGTLGVPERLGHTDVSHGTAILTI